MTELSQWLQETKAKNLTLQQLSIQIASVKMCSGVIYQQLTGKSAYEKAENLFNQWNRTVSEVSV